MHLDDDTRLRHMLDAANEALGFTEGRTKADLARNRQLVLALVKCVEIIGEAASKISDQMRQAHPEVPWRGIVAMRNRLIHGYFDVDLDRVWDTVTGNLPTLVSTLEELLR